MEAKTGGPAARAPDDPAPMPTGDALVLQKKDGMYRYCRSMHQQNKELGAKLCALYQVANCLVVPSGLAAISSAFNGVLANIGLVDPVHLHCSHELYCDTPKLIDLTVAARVNVHKHVFDVTQPQVLLDFFRKHPNQRHVLFLESASNPNGFVFDFDLLPELRTLSQECILIVDNTWLSAAAFNPFSVGADIVVTSLSKYYSAGRCIAGAALTNHASFASILQFACVNGLHVSPLHAALVSRNMDTLHQRIAQSAEITERILQRFGSELDFVHPSLPNHPSHALATKYFSKMPSVCCFVLPTSKTRAQKWMAENGIIAHKTSFGAAESRFDTFPVRLRDNQTLCRLAVGFEGESELIQGIEKLLAEVRRAQK